MQPLARLDRWDELEGGQVLHLAGRLTDEVLGFLGPTTRFLHEAGARQILLAQEPDHARQLARLHPGVDLVLMRRDLRPTRRCLYGWTNLRRVIDRAGSTLRAVHLHGFVPGLVAPYALRRLGREVPLVFSPHSSKAIGPLRLVGRPLWWLTRPLMAGSAAPLRAIATVDADVGAWREISSQPVDVVEAPVDPAFFGLAHREAPTPMLVAGGSVLDTQAAGLLAQLRVLLDDDEGRLRFSWVGAAPAPGPAAKLRAAGIESPPSAEPLDRASGLVGAWAYLAPGGAAGFPTRLGEAMAAGLPCVALDTPYHRSLIRDGETGLLYRTTPEAVAALARLVASGDLRHRLARGARREAAERLTESRFRESLYAAYEQSVSRPMPL